MPRCDVCQPADRTEPPKARTKHLSRGTLPDDLAWLMGEEGECPPPPAALPVKKARLSRTLPEQAPEDILDKAWAAFTEEQAKWHSETSHAADHFCSFLRGGKWTQQFVGVPVDSIGAHACTSLGKQFLERYGLGKMVSFAFRKYTQEVACKLALVWCAVMNHRANEWVSRDTEVGILSGLIFGQSQFGTRNSHHLPAAS